MCGVLRSPTRPNPSSNLPRTRDPRTFARILVIASLSLVLVSSALVHAGSAVVLANSSPVLAM